MVGLLIELQKGVEAGGRGGREAASASSDAMAFRSARALVTPMLRAPGGPSRSSSVGLHGFWSSPVVSS